MLDQHLDCAQWHIAQRDLLSCAEPPVFRRYLLQELLKYGEEILEVQNAPLEVLLDRPCPFPDAFEDKLSVSRLEIPLGIARSEPFDEGQQQFEQRAMQRVVRSIA